MTAVTIRGASKNDAELIAAISRQTFHETFAASNTKENMEKFMEGAFNSEALMKEVGEPGNIFLLAYIGNDAVGYARLRENNNPPELRDLNTLEIARLYAIKGAIGKGVGRALMKKSIEIAEEKKVTLLWLGVWEHNQRAIDFYTKWGFGKFSTHIFMLGNDPQTDWLMKKALR